LDASGTTNIFVRDASGTATGTYTIVLEKFPGPVGCAADVTAAVTKVSITAPGTVTCLTFAGGTHAVLDVRVVKTGGTWSPLSEVYRPDGTTVCSATFAAEFTCNLDAGGTHTLFIRDGSSVGTGTASVVIQRADAPVGCVSLAFGTSGKTGSINKAAELDCFSQTGAAGQLWRVRLVETGGTLNAGFDVHRPDGSTVCGVNFGTDGTCLLDASGTTNIFVRDASGTATGTYTIVLEKFPNPVGCTATAIGDPAIVGNIAAAGQIGCETFSATSGTVVRIRVTVNSGTISPLMEVDRADGSVECSATFSSDFNCTLSSGGKHTLIVRDGGLTGTGKYRAQLS
jgi:hypothetical protein